MTKAKKVWLGVVAALAASAAFAQTYTTFSYARVLNILDVRTSIQNQDSAENVVIDDNATVTGTLGVTGALTVASCSGCGAGSPGGADTQVQYNDAGAFGGDAGMTYNETTDALTLAGIETNAGLVSDPGGGTDELTVTSGAITVAGNLTDDGVSINAASGTFTITYTNACSTNGTQAARYYIIGTSVTLTADAMATCTGDTTVFDTDAANLPAAIRPTTSSVFSPMITGNNNGTTTTANIELHADGEIVVNRCGAVTGTCDGGTWTGSGNRALDAWTISYVL